MTDHARTFTPEIKRRRSSAPTPGSSSKDIVTFDREATSAPDKRHASCCLDLRSCSGTGQWIATLEEPEEDTKSIHYAALNLYECGVDAHTGARSPIPLGEAPKHDITPEISSPNGLGIAELSGVPLTDERPDNKMNNRWGASSHSHKGIVDSRRLGEASENGPLLDELRRYSFMPLEEQTPENMRRATLPQEGGHEELWLRGQRKPSSKELLEEILVQSGSSRKRSERASTGCFPKTLLIP
ncbi:hypothetical protein AB5N19_02948 [Seiridium cardinale]